jgi:hypothetical protein
VRRICLLQGLAKLTYLLSYSRLIDDVLSLSKLDSGMLVVTSVPCRPLSFTRDVLGMFEPELRSKSIAHSFSVLEGYRSLVPSCVKVDPQRVTQVVSRRSMSKVSILAQNTSVHAAYQSAYKRYQGKPASHLQVTLGV